MPAPPQEVVVDGRRLRLTNLDKVMYPETGTTKGEVIDYLTRIAPAMLPHLADRPVTRIRWPDGTGEGSFFAKHLEAGGAQRAQPLAAAEHERAVFDDHLDGTAVL